jgi:hypothetical protein
VAGAGVLGMNVGCKDRQRGRLLALSGSSAHGVAAVLGPTPGEQAVTRIAASARQRAIDKSIIQRWFRFTYLPTQWLPPVSSRSGLAVSWRSSARQVLV